MRKNSIHAKNTLWYRGNTGERTTKRYTSGLLHDEKENHRAKVSSPA